MCRLDRSQLNSNEAKIGLIKDELFILVITMMTMRVTSSTRRKWEVKISLQLILFFIPGGRIFHTATRLSNNSILVYGGRTSPTKPCAETLLLSLLDKNESKYLNCTNSSVNCCSESEHKSCEDFQSSCEEKESYRHSVLNCQGDIPQPRWRHSATRVVLPDGTSILFCVLNTTVVIYAGRAT